MTSSDRTAMTLNDLEAALEAYGADRTRWPAPLRHALSTIISTNPEAGRMLREAEAFDRLLDAAPTLSADAVARLAGRIDEAAMRQPRLVGAEGMPKASQSSVPQRRPIRRFDHAIAAAALAASLVFGIVVGQSPVVDPAAQLLIGSSGDDASGPQIASVDDADGLLEEDLL
ncbi:MAG: hypothetical protein K2X41_11345 [Hyphomicrobium sp.]|nr:hypothetical protein [Hyphomicrobium sp.]